MVDKEWRSVMMRTLNTNLSSSNQSSKYKRILFWFITVCSILSFIGLLIGVISPFLHLEYHFNLDIKKWIIDSNIHSEIITTYSILSACYVMAVPNHIGIFHNPHIYPYSS